MLISGWSWGFFTRLPSFKDNTICASEQVTWNSSLYCDESHTSTSALKLKHNVPIVWECMCLAVYFLKTGVVDEWITEWRWKVIRLLYKSYCCRQLQCTCSFLWVFFDRITSQSLLQTSFEYFSPIIRSLSLLFHTLQPLLHCFIANFIFCSGVY